MKILMVIQFLSPKFGGSVIAATELAKALVKTGNEITIISTDLGKNIDFINHLNLMGVKTILFKCVLNIIGFNFSPSMEKWLKIHIENFDIIHLHNFRTYQNILALKYAKKKHIPIIMQTHGTALRIMGKSIFKWLFDIFFGNELLKKSAYIIAVSELEFNYFNNLNLKLNILKVYNGIDIEKYSNLPPHGLFKTQNNLVDKKIILFLGRIHKIKGLEFLIDSYSNIQQDYPDVYLVIAGPDEGYKKELVAHIQKLNLNHVVFVDYVTNPLQAYLDAEMVIYPSRFEIFGLVPIESILCGTPAIITENCGCSEIFLKENACDIIPYGDINKLSEKIKIILLNENEINSKKIEIGKNLIKLKLDINKIAEKIVNFYKLGIKK